MPDPQYVQETLAEIARIAKKCIERFGDDINMENIARLARSAMTDETPRKDSN